MNRPQRRQGFGRLQRSFAAFGGLRFAQFLLQGIFVSPVVIVGAISRDLRQPSAERSRISQSGQLAQRRQKHILHQVAHVGPRHARQQDPVHHAEVSFVEPSKRGSVSLACRAHATGVRLPGQPFGHRSLIRGATWHLSLKSNCGFSLHVLSKARGQSCTRSASRP